VSKSNTANSYNTTSTDNPARTPFLSREQMARIDVLFPARVLGPDVADSKLRDYMGERKVIEVLRSFSR